MFLTQLDSPIGVLTLTSDGTALTGLWMENQKYAPAVLRGISIQIFLFSGKQPLGWRPIFPMICLQLYL